ncbi:MAG: hypothetical protein Q9219_001851 [cf. Caloplaca sp. 3 TL-2023]
MTSGRLRLLHMVILITINSIAAAAAAAAGPPPEPLPSCFPSRPYCIRPRPEECRDAISLMAAADPGYPVIVSRVSPSVPPSPRTYGVPYAWASIPPNCVVKIDVTEPKATEEVTLKALAVTAGWVLRKCVVKGTGCGGVVVVGMGRRLEVRVGYYTGLGRDWARRGNGSVEGFGGVMIS